MPCLTFHIHQLCHCLVLPNPDIDLVITQTLLFTFVLFCFFFLFFLCISTVYLDPDLEIKVFLAYFQ